MRYCDPECRHAETYKLIDEIEFILGTDHPANIARRLGYKPTTLSQRLLRAGRPDLANHFWRVA
jgi:hypothetical protein